MDQYFSFHGRSNRVEYFLFGVTWIVLWVGYIALLLFLFPLIPLPVSVLLLMAKILFLVMFASMLIGSFAISVRRLHDMGLSGWGVMALVGVSLVMLSLWVATYFGLFGDLQPILDVFDADVRNLDPGAVKTVYNLTIIFGVLSLFWYTFSYFLMAWPGTDGTNRFG